MLKLDSLRVFTDKYIDDLKNSMKEYEHGSTDQAITHIEQVSKAGRGDQSAKKYVLNFIKMNLKNLLDEEDKEELRNTVVSEYRKLLNKNYKCSTIKSHIGYYELIDGCMNKTDRENLNDMNLDKITGIDELTLALYQMTYGSGYLEPLLTLDINNIEVHGTRKMLIETNRGVWKTIEDYRFKREEDIVRVAKRLIAQDETEDITPLNCELEGMLDNGQRVSVALKPGCKENMIFIKKFDGANVNTMDDLVRVGTITPEMKKEFEIYAKGRANIAFIGGINTGKTSTLRGYVGLIPDEYKLGIVESDFETDWQGLYPDKDFAVLKETEKYSMSDQFVRMLRMNRNIMGIGEAREKEVEQWIEAATRGSDGSFMTVHTRTEHDFINNIAWMVLKNGVPVDMRILRYRIASAIDIIIRLWHAPDGKRIVDRVSEIKANHTNLDIPYEIKTIYKRDLKTNKIVKVDNISEDLAEKFAYYNVPFEEIAEIRTVSKED